MSDDDYKNQNESREQKKYADDVANFTVKVSGLDSAGVNRERGCPDCLVLLLFFAMLGGMGFMTNLGQKDGDIGKLFAPLDSDNKFCGYSPGFEDFKFLYFTELNSLSVNDIFNKAVCVKVCPKKDEVIDCVASSSVPDCNSDEIKRDSYETFEFLNYCLTKPSDLPEKFKQGFAVLMDSFHQSSVGSLANDIYLSQRGLYASLAMGLVYCFIYIYFMSLFAEQIVWLCLILLQVGLMSLTYAAWIYRQGFVEVLEESKATYEANKGGMSGEEQKEALESLQGSESQVFYALILVIVAAVLALALPCVFCCCGKGLFYAIDVIDASADFMRCTKRVLLVPLFYFVLTMLFLGGWLYAFAHVCSLNEIEANPLMPQMKSLNWTPKVRYMALFMVFGALWVTAWLSYTSNFITMVSASTYYFNSTPSEEGEAEVMLGFKYAYLNHMGSIAFGALIIGVVRLIRIVFAYISKKMAEASGDNAFVKGVAACGNCCLGCIEKICDYINKNAFAYMAVAGTGFCSSAWSGFLLNLKHLSKFTFANLIATVFIFMGKVAISVGNSYSFYMLMKFVFKNDHDVENVTNLLAPMVVVAIATYITATIFLGLFDTVVKSLLVCLAIDMDINGEEPAHGPPTFHSSVETIKNGGSRKVDMEEMKGE